MSDVVVYDDTAAASAGTDTITNASAFSFTTAGGASGSLVDLKLELMDKSASTDGGYVDVTLYNNAAGVNSPGKEIATVGTIKDSDLNSNGTGTLVDIPLAASASLAPGTRYWVDLTLVGGSNATINYEGPISGTGVSGEYFEAGGSAISNSPGGALIAQVTEDVTCFVKGTRILTTNGECLVQDLVVGDFVITTSGAHRPVRWLGHRTVDCRNHPRRDAVLPVRIAANAFGANRPSRDLYVSPGHSICVDVMGESLVPAGALVNGSTIQQVTVDEVTYWHVELDSHDVILAENLPAESYLEMGNRGFFAEAGVVAFEAAPDAPIATHADFCRPFHSDGPLVEAVRARLGRIAASDDRADQSRAA